ncbi:MAG TPA: hypothetical protein DCY42_02790 [Chloroflexi bacterium]|nr:hypothetical protein [Chloroflexota bacterium]
MKGTTERRITLVLFVVCMLVAGAVYSLGFVKYTFQVAGVNVAIYPAAFLALVGVTQMVFAYLPRKKQN